MESPVDETFLEELRDLMEADFPMLLDTYFRESAAALEKARAGWQDHDWDLLRRSAHSLKGSCANVGATVVVRLCTELEAHARDSQPDAVPGLLDSVAAELDRVAGHLTAYR